MTSTDQSATSSVCLYGIDGTTAGGTGPTAGTPGNERHQFGKRSGDDELAESRDHRGRHGGNCHWRSAQWQHVEQLVEER